MSKILYYIFGGIACLSIGLSCGLIAKDNMTPTESNSNNNQQEQPEKPTPGTSAELEQMKQQYETTIADLQNQLTELQEQYDNITATVGDATISLTDSYNCVDAMPNFSVEGEYLHSTVMTEDGRDSSGKLLGSEIKEYNLPDIIGRINSFPTFSNTYPYLLDCISISRCDVFSLVMGDDTFEFDCYTELYAISSDCSFQVEISFNGELVDLPTFKTSLIDDTKYDWVLKFGYTLNTENKVSSITCQYFYSEITE